MGNVVRMGLSRHVVCFEDLRGRNAVGWTIWELPFFEERHHALAERAATWRSPAPAHEPESMETACRAIASSLADSGLLEAAFPKPAGKGQWEIDVRALCLAREAIAYENVLADTVLAMQGIGTAALWLSGTEAQRDRYLEQARSGKTIAAFALTEPASGSDVANIDTRAERDGDSYIINGEKTFISNAPFADHYVVVARTGEAPGAKGLTAFIVDADTPGLITGQPIDLMAPHPVAPLSFENCRVSRDNVIGEPGSGFKVAMSTFDIFRTSVGAAAVGMARCALDETLDHVGSRSLFGGPMDQLAGVQSKLADMAIDLDTAALAVYRAAWVKDTTGRRCSREASIAKYVGSEHASRIIDNAVQIFGGLGLTRGSKVELLYREVRPTRIYEGASEVQKLIIARDLIATRA